MFTRFGDSYRVTSALESKDVNMGVDNIPLYLEKTKDYETSNPWSLPLRSVLYAVTLTAGSHSIDFGCKVNADRLYIRKQGSNGLA